MEPRIATVNRKTKETDITVTINIDGTGTNNINTGVGFFDHMLDGMARHGLFDLNIECKGDINVDSHHTIEDCGIAIGECLKKALGDKKAIKRYGSFILPMDETLIMSAIDLSGRPYLVFDPVFTVNKLGEMDTEMVREFFLALSNAAGMNLHVKMLSGVNNHHIAEACFKAFGKALDVATSIEPRLGNSVWSTKGSL